jgi:hypothetical protein
MLRSGRGVSLARGVSLRLHDAEGRAVLEREVHEVRARVDRDRMRLGREERLSELLQRRPRSAKTATFPLSAET